MDYLPVSELSIYATMVWAIVHSGGPHLIHLAFTIDRYFDKSRNSLSNNYQQACIWLQASYFNWFVKISQCASSWLGLRREEKSWKHQPTHSDWSPLWAHPIWECSWIKGRTPCWLCWLKSSPYMTVYTHVHNELKTCYQ